MNTQVITMLLTPLVSQVQGAIIYAHVSDVLNRKLMLGLPVLALALLSTWKGLLKQANKGKDITYVEMLQQPEVVVALAVALAVFHVF